MVDPCPTCNEVGHQPHCPDSLHPLNESRDVYYRVRIETWEKRSVDKDEIVPKELPENSGLRP